jgi:predicted O-methyltransferase YrrM
MRQDDSDAHELIADAVKRFSDSHNGRLIDYIEVGVLTGNSAEVVLATLKVRRAVLVDNFSYSDPPSSKQAVENRLSYRYAGVFEVLEGDSKQILPTLNEQFDVGFVDGDHSDAGCLADLTNMLPLIRQDGVIFVHDLTNPGFLSLKQVTEKFAADNNLSFVFHDDVHNALGELRRKN